MPGYRLYFMAPHCAIKQSREFEADDDLNAIEVAEEWRSDEPMELWSNARKVQAWPPNYARPSTAEA